MRPRVLDLGEVVLNLTAMLRRLIGEQVELCYELGEDLPPVWADHTGSSR